MSIIAGLSIVAFLVIAVYAWVLGFGALAYGLGGLTVAYAIWILWLLGKTSPKRP